MLTRQTLNWVKHDAKTRSIHFSRLFQHIRLTSVSNHYLHTIVGEDLVKANRSCIDILLNAMKVLSLMSPDSLEATPPITPRKCLQWDVQLVINCGGIYQEGSTSSTLSVQHARTYLVSVGTCFDRSRRFPTLQTLGSWNNRV